MKQILNINQNKDEDIYKHSHSQPSWVILVKNGNSTESWDERIKHIKMYTTFILFDKAYREKKKKIDGEISFAHEQTKTQHNDTRNWPNTPGNHDLFAIFKWCESIGIQNKILAIEVLSSSSQGL